MRIDFGSLILCLCAVGTILYGCGADVHAIFQNKTKRPSIFDTSDSQSDITTSNFFFMIIASSTMLVTIFYIFSSILPILRLLILFSSCFASISVLWDWFDLFLPEKLLAPITMTVGLGLTVVWYKYEHWLITNFLVFCICVITICTIKINRLGIVLLFTIGFLIYDVFWVFYSDRFFGKSVMVVAAERLSPHVPSAITIHTDDHHNLLGAGDIILPGIVLDFYMRFDCQNNTRLFEIGLIGYVFGLVLAWIMVQVMDMSQPALLWICPSIVAPILIVSYFQGFLPKLFVEGIIDLENADKSTAEEEDIKDEIKPIEWVKDEEENKKLFNNGHGTYVILEDDTVGLAHWTQTQGTCRVPVEIEAPDGKKYIVSTIMADAFVYTKMNHLKFEENSKVSKFNSYALRESTFKLVDIPVSLSKFEINSFYRGRLTDLSNFNLDSRSKHLIQSKSGVIYTISSCNLLLVPPTLKRLFIRESIVEVAPFSCFFSHKLRSVSFPSSLKIIGCNSFQGCEQLEYIEFAQDSQLEIIGKAAFNLTSIKHVDFPASLRRIKGLAFSNCSFLEHISFPEDSNLESIGKSSFSATYIDKITFPSSLKFLKKESFSSCDNLSALYFPDDSKLTEISSAFKETSSIKEIVCPERLHNVLSLDEALKNIILNK